MKTKTEKVTFQCQVSQTKSKLVCKKLVESLLEVEITIMSNEMMLNHLYQHFVMK